MSDVEGDSSSEEEAAAVSERGTCGQFVWPCPRQYPSKLADRKSERWLKPADMSKQELGQLFRQVLVSKSQGHNLQRLHVFDEPHKRYNVKTERRERHKHVVFRMKTPFAHLQIHKALAAKGIHGHFSFNLVGYAAYLNYMLQTSAKKLVVDIDREPWSFPATTIEALDKTRAAQSPQEAARNGETRGRKRQLLTFSEITDAFVQNGVKHEKKAWQVAKQRKMEGDDTLYNTLGREQSVKDLVSKVLSAWNCDGMSTGTLVEHVEYPLSSFVLPEKMKAEVDAWRAGGYKHQVLILRGEGGWGKTELACALVMEKSETGTFHFINKTDRIKDIKFIPGEPLMIDELCLATVGIDDAKALLDLAKPRDVQCRNRDGTIPKGVLRVFTTNHCEQNFWPREAFLKEHAQAIQRRHKWVELPGDIRAVSAGVKNDCDKAAASSNAAQTAEVDDAMDVAAVEDFDLPLAADDESQVPEDVFGHATMGLDDP